MSLNIKNERTHALVRELATLSGMSQTEAVEDAVKRRLEHLRFDEERDRSDRLARIHALVEQLSSHLGPPVDLDDFLYDENGLPK
jgi:antitoxin VapB